MRKVFFFVLAAMAAFTAQAQNIQLHYDFGRNIYTGEESGRQKVTITLEQFKADKWGSWYYFVDVDLSSHFTESVSSIWASSRPLLPMWSTTAD